MVRPRDAAGAALHGVLVEALRDRVLTQSPHIQ